MPLTLFLNHDRIITILLESVLNANKPKNQQLFMIISIIQAISATALIVAIILQNRGTGLGAAFGGEGNVYRTKRGFEQTLFKATIVLAIVFLGSSLINVLI